MPTIANYNYEKKFYYKKQITPAANNQKNRKNIYFCGNNSSKLQNLPLETFFIKMHEYGKNEQWAEKMNALTLNASKMIAEKQDFNSILGFIEKGIAEINSEKDYCKFFGSKRNSMKYFKLKPRGRGGEYYQKYLKLCEKNAAGEYYSPKANEDFKDANVCKISSVSDYLYIDTIVLFRFDTVFDEAKSNIHLIKKAFEKLQNAKNPSEEEINKTAATIQWLFAQECPYSRGTDSIANVFTRALYNAYNMKVSPLKENVSCDFEAFGRNLDEYIKIYPDLFEQKPQKIC